MEKSVKELLIESGETCPFKLSRLLDIKISYHDDFGETMGLYKKTTCDRFFINSSVEYEMQEKVCFHLLTHYIVNSGIDLCINKEDIESFERMQKSLHRMTSFIKSLSFTLLCTIGLMSI